MRHFSCDLCGKDLTPGPDARYVVRMEVYPAAEPGELTATDLDADQVTAMAEMLEELEANGPSAGPAVQPRKTVEYDLCPGCHRKFVADPLGRSGRKLRFSPN